MARAKRRKWDDGYYHANVTIGRNPETGAPIRKFLKAKTNAELDRKIEKVKAEKYTDDGQPEKPITFSEYAAKWFVLTKSNKASNTRLQYQNVLRNHCNIIGDMSLDEIKKSDILLQLQEADGHHPTQEIMLTCYKQVFNSAIDDEITSRNPAANVKLDPEPAKKEKRQLTQFELDCFKKADLTLQERAYLSLLLYTGCRRGEVLALTQADINLRKRIICINKSVKHISSSVEVSEPKSRAGYREIPIFDPLFPVLKDYLKLLDTEYLFPGSRDKSGKYTAITKWEATKLWNTIYEKANSVARSEIQKRKTPDIISLDDPLQGLTPHYFRHNMTTILYYSGIDIKYASRFLGHANVNITLEVYTHLDKEKQAENVKSINRYLSGL